MPNATELAWIVAAPPAAIAISPLTLAKILSSKLLKVIFFSVPPSDTKTWSPCAIFAPDSSEKLSISSDPAETLVIAEPSPLKYEAVTAFVTKMLPNSACEPLTITFFHDAIINKV